MGLKMTYLFVLGEAFPVPFHNTTDFESPPLPKPVSHVSPCRLESPCRCGLHGGTPRGKLMDVIKFRLK